MGFHKLETFPFQKIPRKNKTQVTPLRAPGLKPTQYVKRRRLYIKGIDYVEYIECKWIQTGD